LNRRLRASVRRHRRAPGGSPMRRSIRPKRAEWRTFCGCSAPRRSVAGTAATLLRLGRRAPATELRMVSSEPSWCPRIPQPAMPGPGARLGG